MDDCEDRTDRTHIPAEHHNLKQSGVLINQVAYTDVLSILHSKLQSTLYDAERQRSREREREREKEKKKENKKENENENGIQQYGDDNDFYRYGLNQIDTCMIEEPKKIIQSFCTHVRDLVSLIRIKIADDGDIQVFFVFFFFID